VPGGGRRPTPARPGRLRRRRVGQRRGAGRGFAGRRDAARAGRGGTSGAERSRKHAAGGVSGRVRGVSPRGARGVRGRPGRGLAAGRRGLGRAGCTGAGSGSGAAPGGGLPGAAVLPGPVGVAPAAPSGAASTRPGGFPAGCGVSVCAALGASGVGRAPRCCPDRSGWHQRRRAEPQARGRGGFRPRAGCQSARRSGGVLASATSVARSDGLRSRIPVEATP